MLDKIRKHARGELRDDFHENLGKAMDARCCSFFRVDYSALRTHVLESGGTDEEIFAWCQQQGRELNEGDIAIWNGFLSKRGWRDDGTPILEKYKAASGLTQRADIVTFFDYFDIDEGRAS
jgi:gluconokinase